MDDTDGLQSAVFEGWDNLKSLELESNEITTIMDDTWKELKYLKTLNMDHNKIPLRSTKRLGKDLML